MVSLEGHEEKHRKPKAYTFLTAMKPRASDYKSVRSLFYDKYSLGQESGYLSRYSDGLRAGRPGFDSRQRKDFIFSTAS
jgi:hypothetical protein